MRISDWSSDVCSSDLRCTGSIAVAPAADEEIHTDQREVEEDVEDQQVERQEDAQRGALEEEEPGLVLARAPLGFRRPGAGGETPQRGHQCQRQRDAVDPYARSDTASRARESDEEGKRGT